MARHEKREVGGVGVPGITDMGETHCIHKQYKSTVRTRSPCGVVQQAAGSKRKQRVSYEMLQVGDKLRPGRRRPGARNLKGTTIPSFKTCRSKRSTKPTAIAEHMSTHSTNELPIRQVEPFLSASAL